MYALYIWVWTTLFQKEQVTGARYVLQ
jgi:hypothetical protein